MFILSMLVTVIYTIITGNKVNVYWCVLFFKPPNAKSKPMNPLWLVLGLRHKEHLCRRSKKSGIRWFRYEFQSNNVETCLCKSQSLLFCSAGGVNDKPTSRTVPSHHIPCKPFIANNFSIHKYFMKRVDNAIQPCHGKIFNGLYSWKATSLSMALGLHVPTSSTFGY